MTGADFSLNFKLEGICHGIMRLKQVALEGREGGGGTSGKRIPDFQPPQWIMEHLDKSLMGVERLGENQELPNPLLKDSI